MPRASVWLIRAAMLHLLAGTAIGAWLLAAKGGGSGAPGWLLSFHVPMVLMGWLVQVTIGVAYWILPRHARGPERGPRWAPWVIGGLLNIGIGITAASYWLSPIAGGIGIATAGLGVAMFIATAGPRLKPFGAGR